jgi:hypothetical protein
MDLQLQQEYGSGKTLNLRGWRRCLGLERMNPALKQLNFTILNI